MIFTKLLKRSFCFGFILGLSNLSSAQQSARPLDSSRLFHHVNDFYKLLEANKSPQGSHCFVENQNTLEFYLVGCTDVHKATPHQSFYLSDRIQSRLSHEANKLKTQLLSSRTITDDGFNKLNELAQKDSLGKIIFTKINNKKLPIGWISHETEADGKEHNHRVMDLCSGPWIHVCHFDPNNKLFKTSLLREVYDEQTGETKALPRLKIVDVMASAIYSRGNDDFIPYHYYELKGTGAQADKTFWIPEEWKSALAPLVEPSRLNPKVKQTQTPRGEPNYLTALHPVILLKVQNQDGSIEDMLVFGGVVSYLKNSPAAQSCEDDTGSYQMIDFDLFKDQLTMPFDGGQIEKLNLVPFLEKGTNIGSLFGVSDYGPFNFSQIPEITTSEHYDLFHVASSFKVDLNKSLQTFVVMKIDPNENTAEQPNPYADQKRSNAVREYLEISKSQNGTWKIELSAYNPNDHVNSNGPRHDGRFLVNPETIYKVWSQDNEDTFGLSHPFQRALAMNLKSLEKKSMQGKDDRTNYLSLSRLHNNYLYQDFQTLTSHAKSGLVGNYIGAFDIYLRYGGKESVKENPMRSIVPRAIPSNIWLSAEDLEKETLQITDPLVIDIFTKNAANGLNSVVNQSLKNIANAENPFQQIEFEYKKSELVRNQASFVQTFFAFFKDLQEHSVELNTQIARAQKLPKSKRPKSYVFERYDENGHLVKTNESFPEELVKLIMSDKGKVNMRAIYAETEKSLLEQRNLSLDPNNKDTLLKTSKDMFRRLFNYRSLIDNRYALKNALDGLQ